jgi:hypothetical protein
MRHCDMATVSTPAGGFRALSNIALNNCGVSFGWFARTIGFHQAQATGRESNLLALGDIEMRCVCIYPGWIVALAGTRAAPAFGSKAIRKQVFDKLVDGPEPGALGKVLQQNGSFGGLGFQYHIEIVLVGTAA